MKPIPHLLLSATVGTGLYAATRSWEMAAASIAAGTLVDLDHVFDYVREHGIRLDARYFLEVFEHRRLRRTAVFLHGWEWLGILTIAAARSGWQPWILGVLIGCAHHFIADQVFNSSRPGTYFFVWRLSKRFRAAECFPRAGDPHRSSRIGKTRT